MGKSDNWSMYEIEITRKYKDQEDTARPRIISPETAYNLFKQTAVSLDQESLWVLSLDGQNGLIGIQRLYTGTATGTSVRIAEVVRATIIQNAPGMVLVHNHPSGNIEPSEADMELTTTICKAASLLDIELLDHLIVGENSYTSIRANNQDLWRPELVHWQPELVTETFNDTLNQLMKGGDVDGKETTDPVC